VRYDTHSLQPSSQFANHRLTMLVLTGMYMLSMNVRKKAGGSFTGL
jgi:hypothetical protein